MYKHFFSCFFSLCLLGACQHEKAASETAATASHEPVEAVPVKTPEQLILGRWVTTTDADTGFEPWAFFDESKTYGDGNEEGTPYRLEGDAILYDAAYGPYTNRIVELTETRFVEVTEDGIETVWTKADL